MNWLEEHLETFVKPHLEDLQYRPIDDLIFDPKPLGYFNSEELTIIKNSWRSVKRMARGKKILLPGRDVFVYEILARRENYPTVFMPECSRMTVRRIQEMHPEFRDYFLFDTGFAGSIPKALFTKNFSLLSHSASNRENVGKQTFPRLSFSRGLALKIEQTPKYWESGRLTSDNTILQPISSRKEFEDAARLTIEVYTNSSPKFINQHIPLKGGYNRW